MEKEKTSRRRFLQNTFLSIAAPGILGMPSMGRLFNPFSDPRSKEPSSLSSSDKQSKNQLKEGHASSQKNSAHSKSSARHSVRGAHSFERKLSFYNIHTGESLKDIIFWVEAACKNSTQTFDKAGKFVGTNLKRIDKLFRDHRTGDIAHIDVKLLEFLFRIQEKLETNAPFHLISGFRSLKTNNLLRENSGGVAKHSQHTLGKAADIALPNVRSLRDIQKVAKSIGMGGVGFYSQFVHVDVGRVRSW